MSYLHFIFRDGSNPYFFRGSEIDCMKELKKWQRNYITCYQGNGTFLLTEKEREPFRNASGKSRYELGQEKAREEAIRYSNECGNMSLSYEELADIQAHFEKIGKRYGLLKEFRENAIC